MAFPPHASPASPKRDHIDVLIPYVGPLYINMRVRVGALERACEQASCDVPPPLTKCHGYFKV